jgi:cob(I)alamin adenosyltransferase
MKIYTKKGDEGETGLYGGARVPKDDLRIQTYGTLDELNAVLGIAACEAGIPDVLKVRLVRVQAELFQMGAELATPKGKKVTTKLLGAPEITELEKEIDSMEDDLEPLTTFILPGGSRLAAQLHFARTVSRRAERKLVTLHKTEAQRPEVLQYVNRLSDYLFVSARWANYRLQVADIPWIAP